MELHAAGGRHIEKARGHGLGGLHRLRKNASLLSVILSEAKNLALRIFMNIRDSSSPAAPQNDTAYEFFRSLFSPAVTRPS